MRGRRVALCAAVAALAACGRPAPPERADWVVHARLEFCAADGRTLRAAPPRSSFRLWFPYVIGDLYGAPGAGELASPVLQPDDTLTLDLNRSVPDLIGELEPTHFSLPVLSIVPPQARLARLAPAVLQANGIEPLGVAEWLDARTRTPLLLVYVDRPAHVLGELHARGIPIRYDVRVPAAGFIWIGRRAAATGTVYEALATPPPVVLAVLPPGSSL